jgi:hypothetical protein
MLKFPLACGALLSFGKSKITSKPSFELMHYLPRFLDHVPHEYKIVRKKEEWGCGILQQ